MTRDLEGVKRFKLVYTIAAEHNFFLLVQKLEYKDKDPVTNASLGK